MNLKLTFKSIALIALSVLIFTGCAGVKLPETYNVTPKPLVLADNKVSLDVSAEMPVKSFNKKANMEYTPVLKYEGKEKELKTAYFKGEKSPTGKGQVISYKKPTTIKYNETIQFEPGMENGTLVVQPKVTKGKKNIKQNEVVLAEGILTTYANVLHDEHLYYADRKTAEMFGMDVSEYYEPITIVSQSLTAYFQVNLHDLNKSLALNQNNNLGVKTKELKQMIDRGWTIDKIEIKAYASPEGEERFNEGLSERRALAGKKIVNDIFKELREVPKSTVKVSNPESIYKYDVQALGEDWDGFISAVSASNIKDKNVILNVVRSQATPIQKEQEIRNMTLIYDELKDDVLPPLRRVSITVSFFEPKKTDEEILALAFSKPESLMNKELLYAGTLTNNLSEKEQIYKTYANFFPHDWKGNVNAAAALLAQNKVEEAAPYIVKANSQSANNPIVLNNYGVRFAKDNDIATAKSNYDKAQMVGADVTYNKSIINLIEGKYQDATKNIGTDNCSCNTVLVHLANNDLTKASQVLSCCKDESKALYLKAVIAARTNDRNAVIDNLDKAFKKDSSLIAKAAGDVEFLKYRSDSDFRAITK